ncbi:MAG: hypothetical protein Q9165_005610 [Trypethelium subeluteriae]
MAIKAFGIAVKLTFAGNNQFTHPSTYVFAIVVVVCILTQMNYFNKALSQFNTNIVNPLYYVTFTTFTLLASFILFRGFNTTSPINTISLLSGFLVIFAGVYLLNLSREDPEGTSLSTKHASKYNDDAIPTDPIAGIGTRRSMQARRSADSGRLSSSFGRESSGLMHSYDMEAQQRHGRHSRSHSAASSVVGSLRGSREFVGLGDVPEDSDEDAVSANKRTSFDEEERGGELGEEIKSPRGVGVGVGVGVRGGRTF